MQAGLRGRAVQVDPIKSPLKPPGTKRLKLIYGPYDGPRSNIAFSFNLRRYMVDFDGCFALNCSRCRAAFCAYCLADCGKDAHMHVGRGLHSFTFQLNLSRV